MQAKRASLLNRMMHELPEGYVVDTAWLTNLGLDASSIRGYVAREPLNDIGITAIDLKGNNRGAFDYGCDDIQILVTTTSETDSGYIQLYDADVRFVSSLDCGCVG